MHLVRGLAAQTPGQAFVRRRVMGWDVDVGMWSASVLKSGGNFGTAVAFKYLSLNRVLI